MRGGEHMRRIGMWIGKGEAPVPLGPQLGLPARRSQRRPVLPEAALKDP